MLAQHLPVLVAVVPLVAAPLIVVARSGFLGWVTALLVAAATTAMSAVLLAQATATGFVSRAATTDRGSASGLYLACYFVGGLVGSFVLGQVYDGLGWPACVAGIGLALGLAALLAARLRMPAPTPMPAHA